MGTKANPAKYDCYSNALMDEPMFVLLARDPNAPLLIKEWAMHRRHEIESGLCPPGDAAMVREAYECAEAMRVWRQTNLGKWRNQEKSQQPPIEGDADVIKTAILTERARCAALADIIREDAPRVRT